MKNSKENSINLEKKSSDMKKNCRYFKDLKYLENQ